MKTLLLDYVENFIAHRNETAFVHQRGLRWYRWTYGQVVAATIHLAEQMDLQGICPRDRVLLWASNSPEWVVAFFACLLRGAIAVPLDVQSSPEFVRRVQSQVEAKMALIDNSTRKNFKLDMRTLNLEEVPRGASAECPRDAQSVPRVPGSEADIVEIVFTSGTTAEPKGVCLSNQNLVANLIPVEREIKRYLKWERFVHPIRFLNLVPLSHVFGQFMGLLIPQLLVGEVFFTQSLNPSRILQIIRRQHVSVVIAVPRMLETLRETVERDHRLTVSKISRAAKWSALRRWWAFRQIHRRFGLKFWAFISGGATLNAETEEFWRRLGFVVIQGYGMTETASLISVNHPFKQRKGSIGTVVPGQEVRLSANGEILVRGKNVSSLYWKASGESEVDENGWLHTGDMGAFDDDGSLFFKGRRKDVIVTSAGMNIYPEDIEAALNRQPEVRASAVIPFHGSQGAEPLAVLIMNGDPESVREMIDRVNLSLSEYQRVRRWELWPEQDFPRTPTGKIRKQVVAELVNQGTMPETHNGGELELLISRAGGEIPDRLEPTTNLAADLKLDSLGRVELLSEIESRYGVEINEGAFSEATTIGDVEQLIRGSEVGSGTEHPFPQWPHRFPMNWVRLALLYVVVFPLTRIMGRATVKGSENLDDQRGPLLFIANHLTMVDHALVLWALPGRFRRRMSIAMDGELLRDWLTSSGGRGAFSRLRYRVQYFLVALFFNVFSMPQHSGFRRSFSFAGEMVDRGYNLLVFPEGRRSPDGTLQPFKSGIGLLAKDLNVPVVPVRIDGVHILVEEGKHFAPKGAITVTIGKPVRYSAEDAPEIITKDLEDRYKCS